MGMGGKGDLTGGTLELHQTSPLSLTVLGSSIGPVDGALVPASELGEVLAAFLTQ